MHVSHRDPPQNFSGFLFDILRLRKAACALCHGDGSEFPGPSINVLEKMFMDGLEVCGIIVSGRDRQRTPRHRITFKYG